MNQILKTNNEFEMEALEDVISMKNRGTCCRCGGQLFKSLLPGYMFQCFNCDEDYYSFEQNI